MMLGEQNTPNEFHILDENERLLRARLQVEETMELLDALGVTLMANPDKGEAYPLSPESLDFEVGPEEINFVEVVDACIDIQVIATGTLVAMGVPDKAVILGIDENNLSKVEGPGGPQKNEDGKIIKPEGYVKPDVFKMITTGMNAQEKACAYSDVYPT
jgi:predicted HAD superfamily Cof-like phosphohydrolase